jgi:hypothetical protein
VRALTWLSDSFIFNGIHLCFYILGSESMHKLLCLGNKFWELFLLSRTVYMNLYEINICFLITRRSRRLTTGVSNSYKLRQFFSSGFITSISLYSNGRTSQTADSVSLAFVQREQLARVKSVIRQACCSSLIEGYMPCNVLKT